MAQTPTSKSRNADKDSTKRGSKPNQFNSLTIKLASPETIRSWSYGEVTKPETINYRSFKPEKDGLFCERIFGPVKDWECSCGKYKRIRYKGVVCDRCGVEVTQSRVRRERLGHIELAVPVVHIWFYKSPPSRIGYLLNLTIRELERVIYYESYVVTDAGDPGETGLKPKQLLTEDEYQEHRAAGHEFAAAMGGQALMDLLETINCEDLSAELRAVVKQETSVQRKKDALKRLKVVESFRQSDNRPEWMILKVIPVIPPDLRPLVPLEGGRFATSDLNDLYRRLINRNNRLKKLIEIRAPEVILRNEKRMLQEAVDSLFDNGRRTNAVRGDSKRPLKSLSDLLKGKQGRFRQNLLGKRVDYSGRAVIVVGPELKLYQCGLPKSQALELFKPFIIRKLEEKGFSQTVKAAKKFVERERAEIWDILEEIIRDHPVLLNRAPTLHRLGIQAFYPVLVEGKAIRIHPLVCQAFNADFDGDQMAVHVPLSFEAQLEARVLVLSLSNILSPSNGRPVAIPSQDMVLGLYYLTKIRPGAKGENMIFSSADEVMVALDNLKVELHSLVKVLWKGELIETTPGRMILNEAIPEPMPFFNETLKKSMIESLVYRVFRTCGQMETVRFLDSLKDLGFRYVTKACVTIGIDDLLVPDQKPALIAAAEKDIASITRNRRDGVITEGERYNKVIDTWMRTRNELSEVLFTNLLAYQNGFNPLAMMVDSGARGSKDQISQLAGMRGLMQKPQKKITGAVGEIIEFPIIANFKEGLSVLEYFISTHGARKGLADTALKTADAGYLTRRLVDVSQDVIITEPDCHTVRGLDISALKDGERVVESLKDRIVGRVTLEDVYHPLTDECLVKMGDIIDEDDGTAFEEAGIETVLVRSVLTCESPRGVCATCYGRNLATGKLVDIGEAVGVIAGQSIGEPGTQLTLRTFHIGGTASRIAAETRLEARFNGTIKLTNIRAVDAGPNIGRVLSRDGELSIVDDEGRVRFRNKIPYAAILSVLDGARVTKGHLLFEWDPYTNYIITEHAGTISYTDVREGESIRETTEVETGKRHRIITESRDKLLRPQIVVSQGARKVASYNLPTGCLVLLDDGKEVTEGEILGKLPREISKTSRDITGGLPRVAELFEARRPKDPAVVTEIDGRVEFGRIVRGNQVVTVTTEDGEVREYLIPHGKHMLVQGSDYVRAGERLCEGPVDPHDILRIKGDYAVQEYLVNEIQEVYKIQGVPINDKHIEVIVRQMLQKVKVQDVGDTMFLEGEHIDKSRFRIENERVLAMGGRPATFQPLLLGITKAALTTSSFISAASFQETTRVLTEAAINSARDHLLGLKENVIIGRLIPAGTGLRQYRGLEVTSSFPEEPIPEPPPTEEYPEGDLPDDPPGGMELLS